MQYVWTAVVGFLAGFIGQALGWYGAGKGAGFIGSVVRKLMGGSSKSTNVTT